MNESPVASDYVLDSFALLAYLEGENGADLVRSLLERAARAEAGLHLSVINWGEVAYILERERGWDLAEVVLRNMARLPIAMEGVDQERVLRAAHIKAAFRLSYADAFAIALAQEMGAPLLSGDPEFRQVQGVVRVIW